MSASDEWADWDAAEHDAVRRDLEAEAAAERAAELQHPAWCDVDDACQASDAVSSQHLSRPMRFADPLDATGPMVEQHVTVQLAKRSCEPLDEGVVYLALRLERGPVESVETYRLELETAVELAGVITAFGRKVWSSS